MRFICYNIILPSDASFYQVLETYTPTRGNSEITPWRERIYPVAFMFCSVEIVVAYKKTVKEQGLIPLSQRRVEDFPSGSDWSLSEILAFRPLFKTCNKKNIPQEIGVDSFNHAKGRLKACSYFSRLGEILNNGVG